MSEVLVVCMAPSCDYSEVMGEKVLPLAHTKKTKHHHYKRIPVPRPTLVAGREVYFHDRLWKVEEAARASAVFNNHVDGTQTIAARLVLTRKPR